MATGITKDITLSDGRIAQIEKLSWMQMDDARKTASREQTENMRAFGAELIRVFREEAKDGDAKKAQDAVNQLVKDARDQPTSYDTGRVLACGVRTIDDKPQDAAMLEALDETTADELKTSIVAFSRERGDSKKA